MDTPNSPFKASSCRPSCINRNPATSASRNVDGGGNACALDCSGFDEDEDADDDCNLVTIGPLLLQMGCCCCCCCGSILLLCVDVLVKAFVHAMMRRIVANDFIVLLICSVEYSIVLIEMSSYNHQKHESSEQSIIIIESSKCSPPSNKRR